MNKGKMIKCPKRHAEDVPVSSKNDAEKEKDGSQLPGTMVAAWYWFHDESNTCNVPVDWRRIYPGQQIMLHAQYFLGKMHIGELLMLAPLIKLKRGDCSAIQVE